jgi:hypothetical protein
MENVKIDLRKLPADIGILFFDNNDRMPTRYYNDTEIEKVWDHIEEKIVGKKDVDLLVVGYMPIIMPAKLAAYAVDAGVMSFSICRPGGVVEKVYDWRRNN